MATKGERTKQMGKRPKAVIAAMLIAAMFVISAPLLFDRAEEDANVLGEDAYLDITSIAPSDVEDAVQAAIDAADNGDRIFVIGAASVNGTIELFISGDKEVIWEAELEAYALALDLDGGHFIVSSRGSVTLTGEGVEYALEITGTGGSLGAEYDAPFTVNGDVKIASDGQAVIWSRDGYMTFNGNVDAGALEADVHANGTMTFNGNVTATNIVANVTDNAILIVNGDTVSSGGLTAEAFLNGTLAIKGNITAEGDIVIAAYMHASVSVYGNVNGTGYNILLLSWQASTVKVTGNVTGEDIKIQLYAKENSKLTVNGDVTVTGDAGYVYGEFSGHSIAYISGNISVHECYAILDFSTVTVIGDVTGEAVTLASMAGALTVHGNVTAEDGSLMTYKGNLTVDGEVELNGSAYVIANDLSAIELGGNLIANGTCFVLISNFSVLTVAGDLVGGDNSSILLDYGALMTVIGNVTGGDESLISVTNFSELTVHGNVNAGAGSGIECIEHSFLKIKGDVQLNEFGMIKAERYSNLTIYGDVLFNGDASGLLAYSNSTVIVKGDVTANEIVAEQWLIDAYRSHVTVGGNVETTGGGVNAYGGSIVVIRNDLIASEDSYVMVDGLILEEMFTDMFRIFGGCAYTNSDVTYPSSFVYTKTGGNGWDDDEEEAEPGPGPGDGSEETSEPEDDCGCYICGDCLGSAGGPVHIGTHGGEGGMVILPFVLLALALAVMLLAIYAAVQLRK